MFKRLLCLSLALAGIVQIVGVKACEEFGCIEGAEPPLQLMNTDVAPLLKYISAIEDQYRIPIEEDIASDTAKQPYTPLVVGHYFDAEQQYIKARRFYRLAFQLGHYSAAARYVDYLLQGKGGEQDIQAALALMLGFQDPPSYVSVVDFVELLDQLENTWSLGVLHNELYWWEYAAQKLQSSRDPEGQWQSNALFTAVAERYQFRGQTSRYNTPTQRRQYLHLAREYFKYAEDQDGIRVVNRQLDDIPMSRASAVREESSDFVKACHAIFGQAERVHARFVEVQNQIYQQPEQAGSIIREYWKTAGSSDAVQGADENISLNFRAIDLDSLMTLFFQFDAHFATFENVNVAVEGELNDSRVSIFAKNIPARNLYRRVVAQMGVSVDCSADLNVVLQSAQKAQDHYSVIGHFIQSWSPELTLNQGRLDGEGQITFASGERWEGQFERGLLHGKGKLISDSGETVFEGEQFHHGSLEGPGRYLYSGNVLYQGEFKRSDYSGKGEFAPYRFRYRGYHQSLSPQGKGRKEWIDRDLPDDHQIQFLYSLSNPVDVKSWFEGEFEDGRRHGVGQCGIHLKNGNERVYQCEYYRGNLVVLAGHRLLPPGADTHTHFDWLSR